MPRSTTQHRAGAGRHQHSDKQSQQCWQWYVTSPEQNIYSHLKKNSQQTLKAGLPHYTGPMCFKDGKIIITRKVSETRTAKQTIEFAQTIHYCGTKKGR